MLTRQQEAAAEALEEPAQGRTGGVEPAAGEHGAARGSPWTETPTGACCAPRRVLLRWGPEEGGPRPAQAQGPVPVWELPGKLPLHPGLTLPSLVGLLGGLRVYHRRGLHWGVPCSRSWKRGQRSQSGPEQQGFPDSAWRRVPGRAVTPQCSARCSTRPALVSVCVHVHMCACTRVCAAVRQAWL